MKWLLAFHIIAMVCWFAGLFYLPRLFVYHSECQGDEAGSERFKVMEHKLYYVIMTPSAIVTTALGLALYTMNFSYYIHQSWMWLKLAAVFLLWGYHHLCKKWLKSFKTNTNTHSSRFYRIFNEIPALLLILIVILVVVKPV